jgi:hypothetical protein
LTIGNSADALSAGMPGHVLVQSVSTYIGQSSTLLGGDGFEGGPGAGCDSDPDLDRRTLACHITDSWPAAEAVAHLDGIIDDPHPSRFDVAEQPLCELVGRGLGRLSSTPRRLGRNLLWCTRRESNSQPSDP